MIEKPVRCVLLDLGGVVLDINPPKVFSAWADSAGVDERIFYEGWTIDDAYKKHEVGAIGFAEYAQAQADLLNVSMPLDSWLAGWNELWEGPIEITQELLPAVTQNYPTYALSNTNAAHADSFLNLYGDALSHFRELYLSHEIAARKPDSAAYLKVCDAMGFAPEEVLFLDDSLENVRGAEAVGLQAGHVKRHEDIGTLLKPLVDS